MSTSISAYADTGQNFYAKITTGTAGFGVINGSYNDKYYHLTPGRAGLEVKRVTGGEFEVYLYKDGREIDRCVGITSPTWLRFYDIPEDSSDYYLKIAVTGSSKATYIISGTLHDHGDPE
ncbi:hypothetical protein SNJ89_14840 [Clostridium perfringens]|uniref:hypothetical protein n=1 Tax=Clostridium perfringens TaxID=1502 RepID=UPI0018E41089|nr:hypothetical protein [Clostridium perfringens]MBI5978598.1 hypothetical protein [Clostridium perfringens]MBI5981532.1 hypothetical protein [Clostridium perfringens]MBI5984333.1 hypothetical protein [Clostridium perfringens]MBI5989995.1 hypothetical protein [Clostridium perfringens]MBI5995906.1 hypothetical protein [Clostridium perfringens]